ncbi:MAG: LuxR C-terminal-related transcriptional regulator [Dehalococcoidia bacterium]|jgi:DNA-binding CsgD family transcriptional regulator|nr:LuxR C-terminal-related transcriptional regulator [Dehalococcoidia bacterium]
MATSHSHATSILIDQARAEMRKSDPADSRGWERIYRRALGAAYEERRVDEIAELALITAVSHESRGANLEGLAQFQFALDMSGGSPNATVHLLAAKAQMLALGGDVDGAAEALDAAAESLTPDTATHTLLEYRTYRSVVSCIVLSDEETGTIVAPIPAAESAELEWLSSGLKSWLVPWMRARGMSAAAAPWIDSLEQQARASDHQWRIRDAQSFRYMAEAARAPQPEPAREDASLNRNASWRRTIASLHWAVIRRDAATTARLLERLGKLRLRMSPGFQSQVEAFAMLDSALGQTGESLSLRPPGVVTLLNLPAVLAGAEAIAYGGSQSKAAEWARWLDSELPTGVVSSLEWPVSVERLRGLLTLATGDAAGAIRSLRRAVRWAQKVSFAPEEGLARVQLADVLALASNRTPEHEWREQRLTGRRILAAFDVDPVPHAYAATRALAHGRTAAAKPRLTRREVEVLQGLADGLSYRQVAARLGVQWRTVQTHTHHCYEKLGESGKIRAVRAAEAQGILTRPPDRPAD